MLDKETILDCIKEPMEQHFEKMKATMQNWKPLLHASEKLLAGEKVDERDVPPIFAPAVKFMKIAMEQTEWDWSRPDIQKIYKEIADSDIYKTFAEGTVGIVSSIIRKIDIGTLIEVGTGPGHVSEGICMEMVKHKINIPVIISDRSPTIHQTGERLKKSFPSLTIHDFIWDLTKTPPPELVGKLKKPVLLFERFCLPYTGYVGIDMIGPIADILIMVEDLNLTGKKEAYDIIMEKIGGQFLTFSEARNHLAKHFSFIHTCDKKAVEAINSPVTDFTLAIKC